MLVCYPFSELKMSALVPQRMSWLVSNAFRRNCSTMGALQTLKVKQKIEEKRQAALLGGWYFLLDFNRDVKE